MVQKKETEMEESGKKKGLEGTGLSLPNNLHGNLRSAYGDEQFMEILSAIKASKSPAVINYGSSWCQVCSLILPAFCRLSNDFKKLSFVYADIDECPETTQNIRYTPTFQFYRDGEKVDEMYGAGEQRLRDRLCFTWMHWIGLLVTSAAYFFPYKQLGSMSKPAFSDDGELLDGGFDMSTGGICGYLHDVIYITAFVQIASIISGKFWWTYLVIPGFGGYKAYGLLKGTFFGGSEDGAEDEKARKKREKMEKKASRGKFVRAKAQ